MDINENDRFVAIATYIAQIDSANASGSHSCENKINYMVNECVGGVHTHDARANQVTKEEGNFLLCHARYHFFELRFDEVLTT